MIPKITHGPSLTTATALNPCGPVGYIDISMTPDTRKPRIAVVGAGLAGLSAAVELVDHGCDVLLLESSDAPGGKCGARSNGDYFEEHAYHILPNWYVNFWKLVDRLGVRARFRPQHDYFYLEAGAFPHARALRDFGAFASAWRNLRADVMPAADALLFFHSLIDILSTRLDRHDWYDQQSVLGFLRGRWYMNARVARSHEDFLFKTFAVPSYLTDLASYRTLYKYWLKSPLPMMHLPDGDIHTTLIEPLVKRLSTQRCEIRFSTKVTRVLVADGAAHGVEVTDERGTTTIPADGVVLAVPVESLVRLIADDLLAIAPALARLRETSSVQIGSLTIKLKRPIASVPRGIITLERSRFGLTLVDNGQLWNLGTTLLNVVATDVATLRHLDERLAADAIVDEVRRFIPFEPAEIERVSYLPHAQEPLFASTVGSWLARADAGAHARGLYLCGDHCRSHVGVVCVEAAVTSGLLAAQACCADHTIAWAGDVARPPEFGRGRAWLFKILLTPLVLILAAWNAVAGRPRTS
jgi:predicted NAD/FAD-dependent oxidoreductase